MLKKSKNEMVDDERKVDHRLGPCLRPKYHILVQATKLFFKEITTIWCSYIDRCQSCNG